MSLAVIHVDLTQVSCEACRTVTSTAQDVEDSVRVGLKYTLNHIPDTGVGTEDYVLLVGGGGIVLYPH